MIIFFLNVLVTQKKSSVSTAAVGVCGVVVFFANATGSDTEKAKAVEALCIYMLVISPSASR